MRLNRILTTFIVSVILLCSFTAYAQSNDSENMLKSLGISLDYQSSSYMTRGEAADCITQITGISDTGNDIEFSDVPKTHMYYESISAACAIKAMWTDENGKFFPDDMISAQDFIVAMLNVAGYKDYAAATGGYPTGYSKIISRNNLSFKGLKFTDGITKDQAALLIEKILLMPYCNMTGVSNNGGISYDISSDYTVMEKYFSIKEYQATVTSVGDNHVLGYTANGKGTIGLTTSEGTTYYLLKADNAEQYLGMQVYYYLNTSNNTVVFLKSRLDNEKLVLNYNDISNISADRTKITYRNENNKSVYADLVYDLTIIYNGKNYSQLTAVDLHKPNVTLTLVNTDTDKPFEILFVEEFETVIVGSYVAEDSYVSDMYSGKSYSFNKEDFDDGVAFYENGEVVDFRYIHRGDILSVVTDKDNSKRTVYISNNTVEGKVEWISGDDKTLGVDGEEYNILFDLGSSNLKVGDYIKLYIDYFGNPVSFEKNPMPGGEYAYLIDIGKKSGFGKTIDCKIVNSSGEVVICEFDEKFKINGRKGDYESLESALLAGGSIHQLVFINYNGDKIKNISISNTAEGFATSDKYEKFTLNYSATAGNCMIYASNINSQFIVPSVTPTFYIPLDRTGEINEDEILAGDYVQMSFVQGVKPDIKIYDVNLARIPGAVVVYGVSGKMTDYIGSGRLKNTNVIVVEDIIYKLDEEEDEYRPYIKGMLLGMPKYMYASEGMDFSDLKSGDVIKVGNYRGNELKSYDKVFTLNRDRRDDASILSSDGTYSEESPAYNTTEFTSKFSINGVYGVVEEVGTVEDPSAVSYQNAAAPKLSIVIRPEGTSDDKKMLTIPVVSQVNSNSGGTYIYVYDTSTDTAYSVNPADIELTGKKVYCYIYSAQARAIVVYE